MAAVPRPHEAQDRHYPRRSISNRPTRLALTIPKISGKFPKSRLSINAKPTSTAVRNGEGSKSSLRLQDLPMDSTSTSITGTG